MSQPSRPSPAKVLVGLSGNVLSSVVAALLKHQGFQVVALHFKTDEALRIEAERVAQKLGMHLVVDDALQALEEHVRDHIVHQILDNAQPEPQWMAHQKIIVEGLCAKAQELGCTKIATGHSARVMLDPSTGLTRLVRATDLAHDQSHLLFGLKPEQLMNFILPAGDLSSAAVERLAIELELDPEKLRTPSAGFCAISEDRYLALAEPLIPSTLKIPGQIKTNDGSVIGEHEGLFRYRRGQALPQMKGKGEGMVVLTAIHATHTLVIGSEDLLFAKEQVIRRVNWVQKPDPIRGFVCEARLNGGVVAKCRVTPFAHDQLQVEFDQPQKTMQPGQAVVFYAGDEVLGGGFAV